MKATLRDLIASAFALGSILAGDLAVLAYLVRPWSVPLLGDYHAIAEFVLALLLFGLLSAACLRALLAIRPVQPGEYAMDSPVFEHWKLLTVVYRLGQGALLPFTPVFTRPLVTRLFGAKVGANVAMGGTIDDPWLVSIGAGAVLGNNSLVAGNVIANGKIMLGEVRIGAGATIGVNAVVLPGTEVGEHALLVGGSIVPPGTKIPADETWRGNPARKWQ